MLLNGWSDLELCQPAVRPGCLGQDCIACDGAAEINTECYMSCSQALQDECIE
jgi:hypothetical protein